MATANENLLDATVRHEIGLRRYSNRTIREVISLLNRIDNRIVRELADRQIGDSSFTQRRLELLLDAVRTIMVEGYKAATGRFDDELKALAGYEIEWQMDLLGRVPPLKLDIVTPGLSQVYAAVHSKPFQGRIMREWYGDLEASAFKRVRDEIRMGYVEGRTNDQIIRSIRGTRTNQYRDGILEINRRGAETMVRTALNHTANTARAETYKQNANVIKGIQWVSTLDLRTSAVCRARDGKVYPVDSGPRPPAHPNCRSTTVPVLKSWKELGINLKEAPTGTRASMDGQVPEDLTYSDWLRKQPKDVQDDVLGKTKAELYRKGDLNLDRFVDASGEEYTLDELRKRERKAWEKAGFGDSIPA